MANRKPVEIMDLASIQAVSDPQISPDGCHVVFVNTVMDFEKDEYLSDLWMAELDSGKAYQYTSGRRKDKNPLWSPDGERILFTSTPPPGKNGEKKKTQLYVIDVSGGEARQLTDVENGVDGPNWAPNGRSILFLSNVKRVDRGESDVKVIDRLVYKFNGKGFFENLRKHLFTVPVKGGKAKQVTKGEFDVSNAEWMSDGKSIVFASNLDPDADIVRRSYLYKVDAKGGDPVQLTKTLMSIGGVSPHPKKKIIAFSGHDYHNGSGTNSDVWTLAEGGEPVNLTSGFDQDLGAKLSSDVRVSSPEGLPVWGGEHLYFNSPMDGDSCLYRVHEKGGKVEKVLGSRDHSVEAFTVTDDGTVAYTVLDTTKPMELWFWDGEKSRQVTDLNKDYVKKTDIVPHEEFKFKSGDHTVQGWLMKPPGFDPAKKYPLILHIHGGPRGVYGDAFMHEFQYLAAQGWAVAYVNPWGSGGYHEEYQAALPGHYFEQDYDDLMKAVDVVMQRNKWVDGKRLGVTGGSYGGVMTNWIIGHTDRFAAAVTLRSITNWISFFGCSDIGWTFGKTELGGNWWDMEEEFMAKSPIRYVKNMKTPTMIIHSEEDYRCPMEQGEQLFAALKVLGVPTEFVRFPGESHELSRSGKPKHRKERLEHMARWFKKYFE